MLWMASLIGIAFGGVHEAPCLTMELLAETGPLQAPTGTWAQLDEKGHRDAFNVAFPHERASENFVVKWGNDMSVSSGDVDSLLEGFETAWDLLVEDMGHLQPAGSQQYLVNVYIGDSGSGAPVMHGAAGYFTLDPDGWPMLVMNANVIEYREYGQKVAAHELFHSLQYSINRFPYEGLSAWYWESSANWAADQTYPEYGAFLSSFLAARLLHPQYPVDHFDYPDTGSLIEYFQYGSFILPWFITEKLEDWTIVRDSWMDDNGGRTPLESLAIEVEERGGDFEQIWLEHAVKAGTLDFPDSWGVSQALRDLRGAPEYDDRIAREVPAGGDEDWVPVSGELKPGRYGFNTLVLEQIDQGTLSIGVRGELAGNWDSEAFWGAIVSVEDRSGGVEHHDLLFDNAEAELSLEMAGDEKAVWLTVGVWTNNMADRGVWSREHYSYQSQFKYLKVVEEPEPEEPAPNEPFEQEEIKGCGCQAVPVAGAFGTFTLFLPFLALRRRGKFV